MMNNNRLLNNFKDDETLLTVSLRDTVESNGELLVTELEDDRTKRDFDSDDDLLNMLNNEELHLTFVHEELRHLLNH